MKSIMKSFISLLFTIAILLFTVNSYGGTYYVDDGDCYRSPDKATWSALDFTSQPTLKLFSGAGCSGD